MSSGSDIGSRLQHRLLAASVNKTATLTSNALVLTGGEGGAVLFNVGDSADVLSSTDKWTFSLTEGEVGGAHSAVADADILYVRTHSVSATTQQTTQNSFVINDSANDQVIVEIGYRGIKPSIKGVATAGGTHSSGTPIGVTGYVLAQSAPSV